MQRPATTAQPRPQGPGPVGRHLERVAGGAEGRSPTSGWTAALSSSSMSSWGSTGSRPTASRSSATNACSGPSRARTSPRASTTAWATPSTTCMSWGATSSRSGAARRAPRLLQGQVSDDSNTMTSSVDLSGRRRICLDRDQGRVRPAATRFARPSRPARHRSRGSTAAWARPEAMRRKRPCGSPWSAPPTCQSCCRSCVPIRRLPGHAELPGAAGAGGGAPGQPRNERPATAGPRRRRPRRRLRHLELDLADTGPPPGWG